MDSGGWGVVFGGGAPGGGGGSGGGGPRIYMSGNKHGSTSNKLTCSSSQVSSLKRHHATVTWLPYVCMFILCLHVCMLVEILAWIFFVYTCSW